MNSFNGENKIPRAVADPLTDHTLPASKSLSWRTIATSTALAGTKGTQCELVHGDQWNELKGNHTENIALNQTIRVVGKHKETLVESCYQNIIGPHIVQNNDVRNETRLGRFNLVYGQNELTSAQIGNLSVLGVLASVVVAMDYEFSGIKVEFQPVHAEFKLVHLTMDILDEQIASTGVQLCTTSVQAAATSVSAVANTVNVYSNGIQMSLEHTELTAGVKAWIGPARAHAGPQLGPTPPLAPH